MGFVCMNICFPIHLKRVVYEKHTYPESSFGVLSQFLPVHRHVIFRQPLAEKNRPAKGFWLVDAWEMFQSSGIHIVICPLPFLILNQSEEIK